MARKSSFGFTAIRSEGALLPPDILERIAKEDGSLGGLSESDYHVQGKKLREEASSAWNSLQGSWANFQTQREKLSRSEPGAHLTRERWLMPLLQELGFGRIPPNRESISIDGQSYAISHTYGHAPLHLVGCNVDLDARTAGVVGAAKISPHGLVQSFLNATKDNLWGVVSNGLKLRLLRDNASLTRQAYVEFDLEAIMEGELYSDFVLLWLVCHQSRFESERPEDCWLEKWTRTAQDQGKRALDALRGGVEKSIVHLGQGFLRHPANSNLKEKLRSGDLDKQDYYRQLLRLVYRLLFLFVAEDRDVLLSPEATDEARELYRDHYSTQRLRKLAESHRGSRHGDLWHPLRLVMDKLGRDEGCTALGLAPLGGSLFAARSTADLNGSEVANNDLLGAIRCLAYADDGGKLRAVDYKNLGSEELGSVYESLLELHPELDSEGHTFSLKTASGNERKTTGSYYTPDSLIQCLLDTALDPVVDDAVKNASKKFTADDLDSAEAKAILDLKVVDPAVGSGHFLIAAAHRIAKRLAAVRTGEDEPSPESYRRALRDVIAKCVYGIDMNPMAVELCKVALWMEGVEQGKPLPFLDHHIQCGNSLLGATAELIADGVPDGAFNPIEGDDAALCRELKRKNRTEREGQMGLFDPEVYSGQPLLKIVEALEGTSDHTIAGIHEKERQLEKLRASDAYAFRWLLANAWCAAFALPKIEGATVVTTGTLRRIASGGKLTDQQLEDIEDAARKYRFFHPHLAFPEVFIRGGFDVVVGNPPYLFLSGKGSPSARLRREGKQAEAQQFDRMINLASSLYENASQGCKDLFKWFVARTLELRNKHAAAALVLPASWISLPRFADIRGLTARGGLKELVELGFGAFPHLTVPTSYFVCSGLSKSCSYANISDEIVASGTSAPWRAYVERNAFEISLGQGFTIYRHSLAERIYVSDGVEKLEQLVSITEGDHDVSLESVPGGRAWNVVQDWAIVRGRAIGTMEILQLHTFVASPHTHSGSRAIIRKTGDAILAARVDTEGLAVTHQNAYVVKPLHDWLTPSAVTALLNSRFLSFLYRGGPLGQKGRVMAQLRVVGLRSLPIPSMERTKSIVSVLDRIWSEIERSAAVALFDELNAVVESAYGLSTEDQSEIEAFCSDIRCEASYV